jgi:hypothetical protein
MKITTVLPRSLAKVYQTWDLDRAESNLEYHEAMVRVLRELVEEGRAELRRLKEDKH